MYVCGWFLLGNDESFVCKNSSPLQISGLCKHRQSSRDLPRRESELWAEAKRTAATRLECYVPPPPLTLNSTLYHIHRLLSSPRARCRPRCFSFSFFSLPRLCLGSTSLFFSTHAHTCNENRGVMDRNWVTWANCVTPHRDDRRSVVPESDLFILFLLLLLVQLFYVSPGRVGGTQFKNTGCFYQGVCV